ncbi:hypothetical protein [Clostridium sp.]|uniref:hypothetical protein n=1 Tax=Clostridium sp. TaxID=1506 RepID=UPI001B468467|nr:hypothetical protein [Clostridium sp.]MBP3914661.1 hypothetical protein [Clostridium sp.]
MKMKKLKTGTAMALTLVMMGAPMIKASASEVEKSGVSYEEKLEYVNREKAEFQAEYGTEDKFKVTHEDESVKEEVNGATGDVRITDKETGKVTVDNFYKATKEQHKRYKMTEDEHDKYLEKQFKINFGK